MMNKTGLINNGNSSTNISSFSFNLPSANVFEVGKKMTITSVINMYFFILINKIYEASHKQKTPMNVGLDVISMLYD